MKVGVIGCGYWGAKHVRVLSSLPEVSLVVAIDAQTERIEPLRRMYPSALCVTSLDEVIDLIDAAIIATPPRSHGPLAKRLLAAGKHVLVEKPLALAVTDAERVVAAATAAGRVVLVGHLMVFHPALVRLKELVASGELGDLYYLHSRRVNLGRLRRDENALWSFGPHDVSMIDALLEEAPVRVTASGQSYLQQGIEDVVFATLHFASGAMAHIHLSWLDPRKERRLTLVGSRLMAEFDDVAADKLRIYDKGYERPPPFGGFDEYLTLRDGDIHIPRLAMEEPLRIEARHFVDCIVDGAAPRADAASGLRVIRVLDAAQRSLDGGGAPVALTP
jgi:predicted dehydrogenase